MASQNPIQKPTPEPGHAPAPEGPSVAPLGPPPRMSWPKRIVAVLFVLAVAGLTAASLRPKPPPPIGIQAVAARKGPITRTVTAAGKLQAATEVKLSANVSGDLIELDAHEGEVVTKGQVLGKIDSRRYAAQVRQQEANRASAAADVEVERVQVSKLEQELRRVDRLAKTGNASSAETENALSALDAEKARFQAARDRVEVAEALLSEARHSFSLTTLTSPIDGVITKRQKQVGERVRGSDLSEDPVLIISTLSKMEAKIEVGEHEVVYVKEGDVAEIEIDAFPDQKFPAQVVEVARNATVKNQGTEGEVTTFFVRLALTQPVTNALPGMSAQASIATDTREDAVVVPIQAVTVRPEKELKEGAAPSERPLAQPPAEPGKKQRREPLKKVVFVVEGGVAKARAVETGLASENEIEIVSGLKEGEKVVEGPYRVLSRELAEGKAVVEEELGKGPGKKG
jgi:HlyD family secretion protein